jgi:hypothetical protein
MHDSLMTRQQPQQVELCSISNFVCIAVQVAATQQLFQKHDVHLTKKENDDHDFCACPQIVSNPLPTVSQLLCVHSADMP